MTQNLEERFIETGRGKLAYYKSRFFPGRPTVIFLHGLSSNHTTWRNAMCALAEQGYNSLALDIRGHGLSDKSRRKSNYRLEVLTDDVREIAVREKLSRFALVGYSFGGTIALDYALRHPENVAGLILISTNYATPFRYRRLIWLKYPMILFLRALALLVFWEPRRVYYYYVHGAKLGYWKSVWKGVATMPFSVNLWLLAEVVRADFFGRIKHISAPAVILWSPHDFFITEREVKDMAALMPNAKLMISQNSGHFIATQAENEVRGILFDFLRNHESGDFF